MKKLACSKKSAYLITDRITRRYLTEIDVQEGVLLCLESKTFYLSDARYFTLLKEKLKGLDIVPVLYSGGESVKQVLKDNKIKNLYLDFSITTVEEFNKYKKLGFKILNGAGAISEAVAVKDERELGYIQKACEIAERAVKEAFSFIKKGVTELEVKEFIVSKMVSLGAEGESFDTIVAFGKNAAVPHHETGMDKLDDNQVVLIDTGAKVNGYSSDITRTAFFGTPSERFIESYNSVLKANLLAESKIYSGISTVDADNIARGYLKEKGLDKYFTHSLGHGIGQNIHEYPYLSPKRQATLKDDMVFSIEPGVYFEGEFGIRIEDTVCLKGGKVVRLFTDDKELICIK